MIPLLRFYFHKDIRTVAAESLPYLLDCVKLRDNDYARQLWQYMNKQLFQAIEIESDHEVLGELFLSLSKIKEKMNKFLYLIFVSFEFSVLKY
ncbi:unnamed protein product [Rotaria sp. Silwood1]|nr:unnamed protein product [Rotaria sp. Silwood1]